MGHMNWTAVLQNTLVNILGKIEAFSFWRFFFGWGDKFHLNLLYLVFFFFTLCSFAASEQIWDIAFLARHHCSDVMWDGISADTCTSDFPTAARQVRIHHMPWQNHLISVLIQSQSRRFCYDFWLMTELPWPRHTIPGTWVGIFRVCSDISM